MRIADLSVPQGGSFESHTTHQNGTQADIFLLRDDASNSGAIDIYDPAYSSARTRQWITGYVAVHLPEVLNGGILLSDLDIFGKITTASSTSLCPGNGCPVDAVGNQVPPSTSGLSYVRCKPNHHCHMALRID